MTRAQASSIGAHTYIWSPRWDRLGAQRAATQAVAAGFDLIEIPLLKPEHVDVADTVRLLDSVGLSCSCSLGLPASAHLPFAPDRALAFLHEAVDVAAAIGSTWLTGALYGNLGTLTGVGPTEAELEIVARVIRNVASYAADQGIRLGLELINRYETYILNTTDDAMSLVDRIDSPNVFVHLDTFHMNIEEPSFAQAIRQVGTRLGYVHLAESHRGALGGGLVPFGEIFEALAAVDYDGPLVVEAFTNADPTVKAATATWRSAELDPQAFAIASRQFVATMQRESLSITEPETPQRA